MPFTLPASTGAASLTDAATTEAQQKTNLTNLRGFIAEMLGTDSTSRDTARASLGIDQPTLTFSVGSSALTIALKSPAGADGSSSAPVSLAFRSATLTSGALNVRKVTAASSLVVSSGSTLGTANATDAWLYVYALDNAGTVELAISGAYSGDHFIGSTSAEGGAGAADSATTIYSTTARSSVAMQLLAAIRVNQTTAGTWAAVPVECRLASMYPLGGNARATRQSINAPAQATRTDVASVAGTVDLTTSVPDCDDIRITGTNAITGFTVAVGRVLRVTASAAHTLTNNSNIVTNSGGNIVCAAGDTYLLRATAANTVEVLGFSRAGAGYAIRAWALWDGTVAGTNAPTAGGNVSSVTRNGTGDWTVTFNVALPDTLYAVAGSAYNSAAQLDAVSVHSGTGPTTGAVRVQNVRSGVGAADSTRVSIIVVR